MMMTGQVKPVVEKAKMFYTKVQRRINTRGVLTHTYIRACMQCCNF